VISTHILDTSVGNPAAHVSVTLEKLDDNTWIELSFGKTNDDGRFVFNIPSNAGQYRIQFKIVEYFKNKGIESFFLDTPVAFNITDTNRSYHVPLLLNPYGYSTYRGS